jgi:hypothetical protein
MIRTRMEELRRERARPRAADDFPTIRARMEELRRERALLPISGIFSTSSSVIWSPVRS